MKNEEKLENSCFLFRRRPRSPGGPRYADCKYKRVALLLLTIYAQHQFVGSFFQLPRHRLTARITAADAN